MPTETRPALGLDIGSHGIRVACGTHVADVAYDGAPPPARRTAGEIDRALDAALAALPVETLASVEAIAVTGVRGSLIGLGPGRDAVTPVLPDFDPDCLATAYRLRRTCGNAILERTGCPPFPLSGLPKIVRLLEEGSPVVRILSPQDYVAFRLTGRQAMSAGAALRLGVLDRSGTRLADALLGELAIPRNLFAPLVGIGEAMGETVGGALPAGIPVIAAPGDGPSAHAAVDNGDDTGLVSLGTTTVTILPASGTTPADGVTLELAGSGGRLIEYGSGIGGVAIDWLSRLTGWSPAALEAASRDADTRGLVAHPNFLDAWGEAPGASFSHMTLDHGPAELAAALFDAIGQDAFEALLHLIEIRQSPPARLVVTGGVARSTRVACIICNAFPGSVEIRDEENLAARGAERIAARHLIESTS